MLHSFETLGLKIPQIYLPKDTDALDTWCVIACDQYTSDPAYWQQVEQYVGTAPSTLKMVLPEVYLGTEEQPKRVESTYRTMQSYLEQGILQQLPGGCILTRRTLPDGRRIRTGLVISMDLERYSYESDAKTLIRVTEGTIPSRIPPRLAIREKASLELPHIMVLFDDPSHTVLKPLVDKMDAFKTVYDAPLGFHMGHIQGKFIPESEMGGVRQAFSALYDALSADGAGDPMLFAMGDGNHSFATAKAHWENVKKTLTPEQQKTHPARFALCELVNIHDESLLFEPIHRVLFHVPEDAVARLAEAMEADIVPEPVPGKRCMPFVCGAQSGVFMFRQQTDRLDAALADEGIHALMTACPGVEVDYIHGDKETVALGQKPGQLGLLLQVVGKHELFPLVSRYGALPRKSFSMGEADEKRCYLEAKSIVL